MRSRPVFALLLLGLVVASATAQPVDIGQALELAQAAAGPVRSARLNAEARGLEAQALRHIHRPSVALTGFVGRVRTSFNLDTSLIADATNPLLGELGQIGGINLPPVPSALSLNREFSQHSLSLAGVWPLYTGGRFDALRDVAAGRAAEAQAEVQEEQDKSATNVAQRYFSVQLAREALVLRQQVLVGMRRHLDAARKLEGIGLIARAERLKADVAVADAQREASKAESDLELASVALVRLLGMSDMPQLATSLFVHTRAVGSLQSFVDAGLRDNATWSVIAAKRSQADAARRLSGGQYTPTVLGVGAYNLNRSSDKLVDPTWFVGLLLRVPLLDPLDRRATTAAARVDLERVQVAQQQAERDIPTLVESQWRTMENARVTVLSMAPQIELAQENLRLQEVSFQQQQSATLDVVDARLNLAKVQVQRVQAAYDYVLALARLLEATGQPGRLEEYARSADMRLAARPY